MGDGKRGLKGNCWVLAEASRGIMTPVTEARGTLERRNQGFCLGLGIA